MQVTITNSLMGGYIHTHTSQPPVHVGREVTGCSAADVDLTPGGILGVAVTTHRLHLIIGKIREMVEPEGIAEALAVQGIDISTKKGGEQR